MATLPAPPALWTAMRTPEKLTSKLECVSPAPESKIRLSEAPHSAHRFRQSLEDMRNMSPATQIREEFAAGVEKSSYWEGKAKTAEAGMDQLKQHCGDQQLLLKKLTDRWQEEMSVQQAQQEQLGSDFERVTAYFEQAVFQAEQWETKLYQTRKREADAKEAHQQAIEDLTQACKSALQEAEDWRAESDLADSEASEMQMRAVEALNEAANATLMCESAVEEAHEWKQLVEEADCDALEMRAHAEQAEKEVERLTGLCEAAVTEGEQWMVQAMQADEALERVRAQAQADQEVHRVTCETRRLAELAAVEVGEGWMQEAFRADEAAEELRAQSLQLGALLERATNTGAQTLDVVEELQTAVERAEARAERFQLERDQLQRELHRRQEPAQTEEEGELARSTRELEQLLCELQAIHSPQRSQASHVKEDLQEELPLLTSCSDPLLTSCCDESPARFQSPMMQRMYSSASAEFFTRSQSVSPDRIVSPDRNASFGQA